MPRLTAPDWFVRTGAQLVPALRELAGLVGESKQISATEATKALGWQPRPVADTLVDTARSLL